MLESTDLVVVQVDEDGRVHHLNPNAAVAWTKMQIEASNAGLHLILVSAFRSVARQREIVLRKLEQGIHLHEILTTNAFPGFSEHHSGNAVDIGSPDSPHLLEAFEATAEFKWLKAHAHEFGFSMSYPRGNRAGVVYEPWHWCFEKSAVKHDEI